MLLFVRNSRPALYLGGFFGFLSLFNIGYLLAFALDVPEGRYGFYIACCITLALVFKLQFAYHMPANRFPRESKVVLILSLLISLFAIAEYSYVAEQTPYRFFFDNHIYGSLYASPYVPLVTMIMFFGVMIIFLRQIRALGKANSQSFFQALFRPSHRNIVAVRSFLLIALAELIVNILYMISTVTDFVSALTINQIFNLGLMFVYFFYFIVYINHSRENTSIMVRLVGISLVTLLVATSLLGSRSIQRIEDSFDQKNRAAIQSMLTRDVPTLPPGAIYLASLPADRRYPDTYLEVTGSEWSAEALKDSDINRSDYLIEKRALKIIGEKQVSEEEALTRAREEILGKTRSQLQRDYRIAEDRRIVFYSAPTNTGWIEFGFPYEVFRREVHDSVLEYSALVLLLTFLLLVLFPFFFSSSLIRPLNSLLSGVKQVNEGDLTVHVPVQVEDEIGFLARSFNSMVRSVQDARQRLQQYAESLEQMVEARTRELSETNDALHEAKSRQDGDYFLTSLLLTPLVHNETANGLVHVEFLLKQKKEFAFKKWKSEIGGDYCVADRFQLGQRTYTVFLNADAMGKSIQGGGGILVLGSLFKAILHRSRSASALQRYSPERWLKTSFEEMNSVFRAFDGSMLISFVLGLIDEATGVVYCISAEHPAPVIYEDGKARFLDISDQLMKLGTPADARRLRVQVFRLLPEQLLILGSDGRDDIIVETESGPQMNTSEKPFLDIVERSQGDLSRIYEILQATGEITDDLSLMSIGFDGQAPDYRTVTGQLKEAIAAEDWSLAAILSMRRVSLIPEDTEFLLSASRACRKGDRITEAIDLGERLLLRAPERSDNLRHLVRLYLISRDFRRARELIQELENANPGEPSLPALRAALEAAAGTASDDDTDMVASVGDI